MGFLQTASNIVAVVLLSAAVAALWTVMAVAIWTVRNHLRSRDDETTRKVLLASAVEDSLTRMQVGSGYLSLQMADNVYWLRLMAIKNRANYDHKFLEYRKAAS